MGFLLIVSFVKYRFILASNLISQIKKPWILCNYKCKTNHKRWVQFLLAQILLKVKLMCFLLFLLI